MGQLDLRRRKVTLASKKLMAPLSASRFARSLPYARRKELDQLIRIEGKCFSTRKRFAERTYLQAVYEVYRRWPRSEKNRWARQMAKISNTSARRSSHPIRTIMDCSSPRTDEKLRSRWTLALRYAAETGVKSADLIQFLENAKGGVAGLARKFAKMNTQGKLKGPIKSKPQLINSSRD